MECCYCDDSKLELKTAPFSFTIGDMELKGTLEGYLCTECDEIFMDGELMNKMRKTMRDLRSMHFLADTYFGQEVSVVTITEEDA